MSLAILALTLGSLGLLAIVWSCFVAARHADEIMADFERYDAQVRKAVKR